MVLGKNVAIFDWEWGRNSALREGQNMPCSMLNSSVMLGNCLQQTTSADNIFRYFFFLGALRAKACALEILLFIELNFDGKIF